MEFEQGLPLENTEKEGSTIIKEYVITVENLKQELQNCKVEQATLRSQLGNIQESNKATAATVRDTFSKSQINDNGVESPSTKEMISNLQKRITIVQMEKESVFQLWQMALKAIDILEEELRGFHRDGKGTKFYEEQMNGVRETYSDAIKALEAKLVQARENFIKQQTLWETSKDKINVLTTEKDELLRQFLNLQKDSQEKDLAAQQRIETLKAELTLSKSEVRRVTESQIKLEAKLREAQQFIATVVAKDNEAKSKVSEAIELVESAVKEKELALQREARAVEERLALENNVPKIVEEYKTSLETETSKLKEAYERNIKKYALDMKELKVELQQKSTLLDRAQRESRLVEEELNKVRLGSDDFLHHSNAKFLALQQQLQDAEFKLQVNEETCRKKYTLKIQQLEQHVTELEEKLVATGDQLKRMQKQSCREMEERVREADERTKEAVERYANLERRLARTIDERESVTVELRLLQGNFDRDIKRKDQERRFLENRVRELQEDVRAAASSMEQTAAHGDSLARQINILELELKKKAGIEKLVSDTEHRCKTELIEKMKILQEKCDRRTKELTQHVETHQKLSNKWKEEAKRLTSSFRKRLKELRAKVIALQKENEELNKELLASRYQLAEFRERMIHRYDQGDTPR
ncbi:sodium channel and clathrin linker 1-like isoform X1 [Neodiprion fabricii]|uniref:sodium channel and clathrin linker 1-like isoform X1 n=1 Tax=Neodiprion fabricii TaxID=2872261 RepID=UPI001ED8FA5B|nr:sodium channel and clathrin linker 1-like isoform X1 [Neodiprion fabricii]